MPKRKSGYPVIKSPRGAIRAFCTECYGGETDPRECHVRGCPLWKFRGWSDEMAKYMEVINEPTFLRATK